MHGMYVRMYVCAPTYARFLFMCLFTFVYLYCNTFISFIHLCSSNYSVVFLHSLLILLYFSFLFCVCFNCCNHFALWLRSMAAWLCFGFFPSYYFHFGIANVYVQKRFEQNCRIAFMVTFSLAFIRIIAENNLSTQNYGNDRFFSFVLKAAFHSSCAGKFKGADRLCETFAKQLKYFIFLCAIEDYTCEAILMKCF